MRSMSLVIGGRFLTDAGLIVLTQGDGELICTGNIADDLAEILLASANVLEL